MEDSKTIRKALGLPEEADLVHVIEKIEDLSARAGEPVDPEPVELQLLKAGEHEQCAINPDGTVTVTLFEPIIFGKESLTELTLRRPKMKDLKRADEMSKGNDNAHVAAMIELLSCPKQATKIIDELDIEDVRTLGAVCRFLCQRRPRTGQ